jgi:hypothetical protein
MLVDYENRHVVIEADDEHTKQRYKMEFGLCSMITFRLSLEELPDSHLTAMEFMKELPARPGFRQFLVHFWDESELEIECKEFHMENVDPLSQ